MEDINYNEVFGLEQSEETQEVADPAEEAQTDAEQSEETQEVADPAVDRTEEDSKYAAARRKAEAERDAAIAQAQEQAKIDAKNYIEEALKGMGLKNPYTNASIETKEDYEKYKEQFTEERQKSIQKKSGMSETEFSEFINQLPQVRQAQEQARQAQAAQAEARKAAEQAEINRQLEAIKKLDPTVESAADILKMDTADIFKEKVARGYTFEDAFRIANSEKLMQAARESAKQAVLNAQSKGHMTRTSERGSGMEAVPADILAEYREFLPNASEDEIRAHYNRYIKR